MEQISKGKSLSLAEFALNGIFQAALSVKGIALDFASFGLDIDGKLSDERYMTFFNQTETPCGGIKLCQFPDKAAGFAFNLNQLPISIERIVIAASIDGNGPVSQLRSGYFSLMDAGSEFIRFSLQGSDFSDEKTVILAEIYRTQVLWPVGGRDWRFKAINQGFIGGLPALVQHYGASVVESALPASVPDAATTDALPSCGIPPGIVDFLGLSIGTHTDIYLRQLALHAAQHIQARRHTDRLETMFEQMQGHLARLELATRR